jgi:hypothetical protein
VSPSGARGLRELACAPFTALPCTADTQRTDCDKIRNDRTSLASAVPRGRLDIVTNKLTRQENPDEMRNDEAIK